MWSAETVAVVALTFFIGGFVKGVVGLGLPTISLAALTATLGLHPAMALVLAPSLATNLLQATRGGHGKAVVQRLWPYLLATALGIWLGVRILVVTDAALLSSAAAIPAMGGMVIGQRLSRRLAEAMFKKLLFAALLFLGLYILVR